MIISAVDFLLFFYLLCDYADTKNIKFSFAWNVKS